MQMNNPQSTQLIKQAMQELLCRSVNEEQEEAGETLEDNNGNQSPSSDETKISEQVDISSIAENSLFVSNIENAIKSKNLTNKRKAEKVVIDLQEAQQETEKDKASAFQSIIAQNLALKQKQAVKKMNKKNLSQNQSQSQSQSQSRNIKNVIPPHTRLPIEQNTFQKNQQKKTIDYGIGFKKLVPKIKITPLPSQQYQKLVQDSENTKNVNTLKRIHSKSKKSNQTQIKEKEKSQHHPFIPLNFVIKITEFKVDQPIKPNKKQYKTKGDEPVIKSTNKSQKKKPLTIPRSQIDQYFFRREQQTPMDLGVRTLLEIIQQCNKQRIISDESFSNFKITHSQDEVHHYLQLLNQARIQDFNFNQAPFTIMDHRRLSQLLVKLYPTEYTIGQVVSIEPTINRFLIEMYAIDGQQYLKIVNNIDKISKIKWWDKIITKCKDQLIKISTENRKTYKNIKPKSNLSKTIIDVDASIYPGKRSFNDLQKQNEGTSVRVKIDFMKNEEKSRKIKPHLHYDPKIRQQEYMKELKKLKSERTNV